MSLSEHLTQKAWICGGEYEDNGIRAAILGDSVVKESLITDHIPDIGKKLAIAVKALEEINRQLSDGMNRTCWDKAFQITENALKEIQG